MIIGKKSIDIDSIYKMVSEEDILTHYFNINRIPCVINSPLRKDRNPSFALYYRNSNKISYYDYGTKESGGVFDLLMNYFHLTFPEVLEKISKDLSTYQISHKIHKNTYKHKLQLNNFKLNVKVRDFKDYDLEYWQSYGINKQWLEFGKVYPISDIFIEKNNQQVILPAERYAYAYIEFKDDKQTIKVYQPKSNKYKWIGDTDSSVWDLWSQLPKQGEYLIITSSRKDALCLWANLGIPSCCLQSEGMIPKSQVIKQLQDRFKTIFILYDNDFNRLENVGQNHASELVQQYNFINICIPTQYECKDPSDLYKKYGKEKFILIFKQLLQCG